MNQTEFYALLVTVFAGLSTGVGSALAFFTKTTNKKFLAGSMGFSAGVMIYVSFLEIVPKAHDSFTSVMSENHASWYTTLSFFAGILLILLIDKLIPSYENPHEPHLIEEMNQEQKDKRLYRIGVFSAIAIGIHNFPEGIATFAAYLADPALGIPIAIAIAIHNIPEGIAVSVPVYYATKSKKKAFWLSLSSGLAEPIGAMLAFLILRPYLNEMTFGMLFSAVAGIMVFISLDELLPTAREYDTGHTSIYGVISGMALMALSLLLLM